MIDPASLIGFGLALVACSWACSALLAGVFFASAGRLRRLGPAVERRAAAAVLVLPAFLGFAIVAALVARSVAIPLFGLDDHCTVHGHHLHLCLFHGHGWTDHLGAIVPLTVVGTFIAVRLVQIAITHLRTARALARLRSAGKAACGDPDTVLAPSERVFLFVAGVLRPRIYMSTAAWDALGEDERAAALAHEKAHARQGDVLWRTVYQLCALLGAPLLSRRILARWSSATERHCDRQAATAVGSPEPVAQALITLARRTAATTTVLGVPLVPPGGDLDGRVRALLDPAPFVPATARSTLTGWVLSALLCAILAFADPLHHALETVFGVL